MTQQRILAFDTATGPCSVAIWADGRIAAYEELRSPASQSASLIPMIERVLAQSGLTYEDLSLLAVTLGPGSFTGIRVALAAARGIALAAGIPALGFTTLQTLAFAASGEKAGNEVLAALNAGKGEWYFQRFGLHPWRPLEEAQLGALPACPPGTFFAGNAMTPEHAVSLEDMRFPRADILARLAQAHPELGSSQLSPVYIRPPDAKLPQAG